MLTRYTKRVGKNGIFTVNSAKKDRNTQTYWYYVKIKGTQKHFLLDVRSLDAAIAKNLPTNDHACLETGQTYEEALCKNVQFVADLCNKLGESAVVAAAVGY